MSLVLLYNNLSAGLQHFKALTEAFANADSISTQVVFNFGLTDTYNLNDVKVTAPTIVFNDTYLPTEGIVKSPLKSLLETLQGGASLSLAPHKTFADTFALSELKTALVDKYLSEQANVDDLISRVVSYNRTHSEQITLTDTRVQTLGRLLTESATINDNGILKHPVKALSDAITYTDVIQIVDHNFLYFAEAILANDIRDVAAVFDRDLSDSQTLSELKSLYIGKAISDSANILEVQESQWNAYKTFLDTFSLEEALARTTVFNRALTDTLQPGELSEFTSIFNRQYNETITMSEVLSKLSNLGVLESLNIADSKEALAAINMAESLLSADDFQSTAIYSRALAEVLVGSDSTAKAINTVATDILNLLESFSKHPSLTPQDIVSMDSSVDTLSKFDRDFTETGLSLDSIYKNIVKDIETTETILDADSKYPNTTLVDQALAADERAVGFNKVFSDIIRIEDSFAKESIWYKTIDNSIEIRYIIDMAMIRRKSTSGFVWKDAFEGSQKMFGKRKSKKGFVN